MNSLKLLLAAFGAGIANASPEMQAPLKGSSPPQFRTGAPSRRKSRDKTGLPSGFPGAKLARKALQHKVGVCH